MFWKNTGAKYRVIIGIQIAILLTLLGAISLHVYDYTEYDPTFCVSCHIMKEPFAAWEKSIHKGVTCHDCHKATILERNRMLIKALVERPLAVSKRPHEKIIVPSSMCIKCHWGGDDKIKKISKSTGHALHWFKASIECTACHAKTLHKFAAEQNLCVNCHDKGRIVLSKMQDMVCTDCHDFRGNRLIPKAVACIQCHTDRLPTQPASNSSPAHTEFDCMTCHHTHAPEKPAAKTCTNCHSSAQKRGKHPLHIKNLGDDCIACHKPHVWHISEKDGEKLCSECHKQYPLKKFGG